MTTTRLFRLVLILQTLIMPAMAVRPAPCETSGRTDAIAAGSVRTPSPPETRRQDVVDLYHGDEVVDPYRWLEAMEDPQTVEWTKRQDAYARAWLEPVPGRDAILARLDAIRPQQSTSTPQVRGGRLFYQVARSRDERPTQRQLVVEEADGTARVLVDLDDHPEGTRFAAYSGSGTPSFQASPDGRYVAFGLVRGSSQWTQWSVVDTTTGQLAPDRIGGIRSDATPTVWWSPESDGFFYGAYREQIGEEGVALRDQAVYFHRLGEEASRDRLVYRDDDPERYAWLYLTSDGRYLAVKNAAGNDEDLYLLDLADGLESPPRPKLLLEGEGRQHSVIDLVGDRLWVRTTLGADRGRIVALDPERPEGASETVVPEGSWGALIGATLAGGRLLVHRVEHAVPKLELYDLDGELYREVMLPYVGWLRSGLSASRRETLASFFLQGTADPGSVYLLDTESGETRPFHHGEAAFDPAPYATRRVFYPSHDGTLVPLFLMHKKGLTLDGTNPVWLYAYGSRWSAAPWYQSQHRLWIELGGVYALAHVRGGGEYGDSWIEAGSGTSKQTGIGDFLAAAEWLVESSYTSPERLVANGGSASGPLAAAAVNQRPGLFRAALIDYPLTDMLRFHEYRGVNVGNFDTPEEPEAYRALRRWSPYHNVRRGVCYPATLVAHGNEDRLAVPLHSYKLTAALQEAQSCGRPILLQVAWGRGHTVGGLEERANQLAFLIAELGLGVPESWGVRE